MKKLFMITLILLLGIYGCETPKVIGSTDQSLSESMSSYFNADYIDEANNSVREKYQ